MDDSQDKELIVTENLKKVYSSDGVPVEAVRGIDLIINSGEFSAIVGPSGSGKTTLLNIISGLDKATEGEVWFKGRKLSDMRSSELSDLRRDHIGFIFQAYNLIPVLTVEENIEYIMLLQGVPKDERHQRVIEILKEIDLEGFEDRKTPQISGGQQQRVAVARAMVSKPSLILADEPTANLDSKTGESLLDMMRKINDATGMTFVFYTNDPMVMKKARRLKNIKDGLISEEKKKSQS